LTGTPRAAYAARTCDVKAYSIVGYALAGDAYCPACLDGGTVLFAEHERDTPLWCVVCGDAIPVQLTHPDGYNALARILVRAAFNDRPLPPYDYYDGRDLRHAVAGVLVANAAHDDTARLAAIAAVGDGLELGDGVRALPALYADGRQAVLRERGIVQPRT